MMEKYKCTAKNKNFFIVIFENQEGKRCLNLRKNLLWICVTCLFHSKTNFFFQTYLKLDSKILQILFLNRECARISHFIMIRQNLEIIFT